MVMETRMATRPDGEEDEPQNQMAFVGDAGFHGF